MIFSIFYAFYAFFFLFLLYFYIFNSFLGKNVVAFSWPEPQFSGTVTPYLIGSGKFAWLEGDVSEASNSTGFASFKNLTVFLYKK